MFRRLQNTLRQFMMGRYGADSLGNFLMVTYLVLWVVSRCFPQGIVGRVLSLAATGLAVWFLFRMLSRNLPRRQAENEKFMRWWWPTKDSLRHIPARLRDIRRFRYRRCPGCRCWLRLPIKRGRRTVTCSRCRREFKSFFL